MATEISQLSIGGADRKADAIRVDLWRTVNAVGSWAALLRNTAGKYNGVFDVQDQFLVDIDGLANTLMEGRVDMDAVQLTGEDNQSDWDEYITIRGVDQGQDLLFHSDFAQRYPDTTQQIKTVLNDIFNVQITTNITYAVPAGATPVVGGQEWMFGGNFLAQLQEMMRDAGYIFYVDDSLALQSGAPGFSASGVTLRSEAGDTTSNIIDVVDLTERDGTKLYNKIWLFGKNPSYDGWTEYNAALWSNAGLGGTGITNDAATIAAVTGNQYSVKFANAAVNPIAELDFTGNAASTNYSTVDLSKGSIEAWFYYNVGTSLARRPIRCTLSDGVNNINYYGGANESILQAQWGRVSFPCGENVNVGGGVANEWWPIPAVDFNWAAVDNIRFRYEALAADKPTELFVDGLTLPLPVIGFYNAITGTATDGTGTMTGSPVTLNEGLNQPTVTVAGTFTIDLPDGVNGIAATNGWVVTGSPVSLVPGANVITVQPAGAGVIDITLSAKYRVRPYIDSYPNLRTHNAIQTEAETFANHHSSTGIDKIRITTAGNASLRYAGQSVTVDIPSMGLTDTVMYMTSIHHIIQPYVDVSGGYGFDWVTEVEAVPTSGVEYDMNRLRDTPARSAVGVASRAGIGIGVK